MSNIDARDTQLLLVLKFNEHHAPAGSPEGGQFTSGDGVTHVGITSNRADEHTSIRKVIEDGKAFAAQLAKVNGVKSASIAPGWGGWDGGREPSWSLSYKGDSPEAMSAIAEAGKRFNQDSVLVIKPSGYSGYGAAPSKSFTVSFDRRLHEDARSGIEKALVKYGIGGWSWHSEGKNTTLRVAAVPQWGGDANQYAQIFSHLHDEFRAQNLGHTMSSEDVSIITMTRDGDTSYDHYIKK